MLSRMLGYNLQTNLTKRKRQTENLNSQRILANSKGSVQTPRILLSQLDDEPLSANKLYSNSILNNCDTEESKTLKRLSTMGNRRYSQANCHNLMTPLDIFRKTKMHQETRNQTFKNKKLKTISLPTTPNKIIAKNK